MTSEKLRPFFERARVARVDVVAVGDSNQLFGGHGWDHGWTKALADEFGVYATGLQSAGENGGNGAGVGYTWVGFSTLWTGALAYAGAPPAQDVFLPGSTPLHPCNYLYLAGGSATGGGFSTGITVEAGSPLGVNGALRFHVVFGLFTGAGPGSLRPAIRLDQPPYSNLVVGSVLSTRAASDGVSETTLDLPAAQRNAALGFRFVPAGVDLVGPCVVYWSRVERVDRTAGASFHTLMGLGGASARRMAQAFQSATDEQLSLYFSLVRAGQESPRHILVRINTGLNDRNETLASLGPAMVPVGNSAAALADNLRAIMDRIAGIWTLNGWPADELYYLLSVSHPVSQPDDAPLVSYREAVSDLAAASPRCGATRFDRLTSATEMLANGWYQSGGADRNHLTQSAFVALASREMRALLPLECPGDANADGSVDFADVSWVLARWGECAPLPGMGDASGDRRVGFTDITAVLAAWGGCGMSRGARHAP
ncbi:MAG: hypothetical protein JNK58_07635 [Phycisphaerae bacterium]|nr:hypothetical protein [Phycisphaerae bacterium]